MKSKKFNSQEVQAIIAGNKTMFREVIKKPLTHFDDIKINQDGEVSALNKSTGWYEELKNIKCPYKLGQEIFVKGQESPIALKIKSVKVERLEDISEENALAEGIIYPNTPVCCHRYQTHCCGNYDAEDPSYEFKQLWDSTHKKPEEKWEANPWVFAYEFEVINFKK